MTPCSGLDAGRRLQSSKTAASPKSSRLQYFFAQRLTSGSFLKRATRSSSDRQDDPLPDLLAGVGREMTNIQRAMSEFCWTCPKEFWRLETNCGERKTIARLAPFPRAPFACHAGLKEVRSVEYTPSGGVALWAVPLQPGRLPPVTSPVCCERLLFRSTGRRCLSTASLGRLSLLGAEAPFFRLKIGSLRGRDPLSPRRTQSSPCHTSVLPCYKNS